MKSQFCLSSPRVYNTMCLKRRGPGTGACGWGAGACGWGTRACGWGTGACGWGTGAGLLHIRPVPLPHSQCPSSPVRYGLNNQHPRLLKERKKYTLFNFFESKISCECNRQMQILCITKNATDTWVLGQLSKVNVATSSGVFVLTRTVESNLKIK